MVLRAMTNPSPNYEALLEQDDWLRRIARSLVRDPDLVDDLVQEAWVASLEHGRKGEEARPWLLGVVRNAGARVFRTAERQRDRAFRKAQESDASERATDDVVADLQLRERLTHELRSLEEPFRFAVYQRFVSGLSLKELAQLTEVSVSTASERVQRGLALLRRRMDSAHGGDRRAWVKAALPLVMPKVHVTSTAGALALSAGAKVTIGLAAAGAVLFLTQRWSGAVEHPSTVLTVVEGHAERPASASPESQTGGMPLVAVPSSTRGIVATPKQNEQQAASATPASPGSVLRIVGRVKLPNGTHSRRARWSLGQLDPVGPSGSAVPAPHLKPWTIDRRQYGWTDWDGKLDTSFRTDGATSATLVLKANDCVSLTWARSQDELDQTIDIGAVTLDLGGRITGSLVDGDGQPLLDASYTVRARSVGLAHRGGRPNPHIVDEVAYSDPMTGAFELRGIPSGSTRVTATGGNVGAIDAPVFTVTAGETTQVDLVAPDAQAAARRVVVTLSPRPYRSVPLPQPRSLRLVAPDGSSRTAVRDSGHPYHFRFEQVGPGAHTLEFDDSRHGAIYKPWVLEDVHAGGGMQGGLQGRATMILDLPGGFSEPLDSYSLELECLTDSVSPRSISLTVWSRSSVGGGVFGEVFGGPIFLGERLEYVIPGDYLVTVRYGDRSASARVDGLLSTEKRVVHLVPEPRRSVSGRVMRADGAPAADVTVRLVEAAQTEDSIRSAVLSGSARGSDLRRFRLTRRRTTTGSDGTFRIDLAGDGRFLVIAGDADGPLVETEAFDVARATRVTGVELVLPGSTRLRGRVDAPAGLDLSGWRLVVIRPDRDVHATMTAPSSVLGPDHRFILERLAPGRIQVYLAPLSTSRGLWGYVPPPRGRLLAELTLAEGENLERTFQFSGPLPASVTIDADVTGTTASLVEVRMFALGSSAAPVRFNGLLPALGPALVDAGTYDVVLVGDDWSHAVPQHVTVAEGASVHLSVEVPLVTRSIRITDAGRAFAHRGVTIESTTDTHSVKIELRTDAAGAIMVRQAAGTYRLSTSTDDAGSPPRRVEFRWPLLEDAPVIDLDAREPTDRSGPH